MGCPTCGKDNWDMFLRKYRCNCKNLPKQEQTKKKSETDRRKLANPIVGGRRRRGPLL